VVHADIIKNELRNPMLEITVCDTGIGIREQDKDKIFKMFGKLETTEHLNTSGVGLGVSICKQIIEGLGGELTLTQTCRSKLCSSTHQNNGEE
jgi:K+-sensing histidine kinase KdpD